MRNSRLHGVALIDWPTQDVRRDWFRDRRIPRVLVVAPGHTPPVVTDVYEDWVRMPVPSLDLDHRALALAARRHEFDRPQMDHTGHLVFRGERVAISPAQAALARRLTEKYGHVVLRPALSASLGDRGDRRNVLDLNIARLRRRVETVGLAIRTEWGCGYVLVPTDAAAREPTSNSLAQRPVEPARTAASR